MQAVVSYLSVVVSHKGDSVAVMKCGEAEGVKKFPFCRQVRSGSGGGLAHDHVCFLVFCKNSLDAGHQSMACILGVCSLQVVDAGVYEDRFMGGGLLCGLQAVGDGGRLFLSDVQSVAAAQSYRIHSVHNGVM